MQAWAHARDPTGVFIQRGGSASARSTNIPGKRWWWRGGATGAIGANRVRAELSAPRCAQHLDLLLCRIKENYCRFFDGQP